MTRNSLIIRMVTGLEHKATPTVLDSTIVLLQGKNLVSFLQYIFLTREGLVNFKKLWKHSPAAHVPTAFLILPNLHSCCYNLIETPYKFSIP